MHFRLVSTLLFLAPFCALAQEPHADDKPAAPEPATTSPAAPPAAQTKAGRGAGRGAGGRGFTETADLNAIIANAEELEKGRKLFAGHCVQCHGPKGEGDRGPTLVQPKLPRASDDASLLRIVRGGIPGTEMPRPSLKPGEAPYVAAYVKSLGQLPMEPVPGDPIKGAELVKTKGACQSCHTINGQGLAIGPDLSDIGRRRSVAFLRRSLLEPGAEVPQSFNAYRTEISMPLNFLFIRARTTDGKEYAGVRVNEDAFSIQIRDLTGRIHSFFKSELSELVKDKGQSPMPAYAGVFSPAELDDVVAYLVSLRGEKK
jgi:cytochrome c oxidase cbb3-type subunit III